MTQFQMRSGLIEGQTKGLGRLSDRFECDIVCGALENVPARLSPRSKQGSLLRAMGYIWRDCVGIVDRQRLASQYGVVLSEVELGLSMRVLEQARLVERVSLPNEEPDTETFELTLEGLRYAQELEADLTRSLSRPE